jgi:ABC-type sugar transport system ATPase subunit
MTGPAGQPSTPAPEASVDARLAVAVSGLTKAYGGVQALAGMDLAVETGSVHAVVGENGAGKSTLMKILAGAVHPDGGEIAVEGQPARLDTPQDARQLGIGIVYQELSLFPERSVLANLFPAQQPTRFGLVDRSRMLAQARPVLQRVGLQVDPDSLVGELDIDERQLVEICRLLIELPRVLILDEPTSALNERETQRLFGVLRELSADGVTILYVSHLLQEVFAIADQITVMRNGRAVFTQRRSALSIPQVVEAMVGGPQGELYPPREAVPSTEGAALEVDGLSAGEELRDVTFTARAGEIVGLAGLEGSGVATLLGVLFGTRQATEGQVRYPDGGGLPSSPTSAARRGISLVPADRRRHGLMLDRSIAHNIGHVSIGTLRSSEPWLRRGQLVAAARRQIEALRIKADSPGTPVDRLSGGNQQKVVLGKWLEVSPRVMLLDDPTRGVDVGAKREFYLLIRRLALEGRVVLFRSTELPELVGLADRIFVFYRGRLAVELRGGQADDHAVLHAINTGQAAGQAA